jgi:hypothetical protein
MRWKGSLVRSCGIALLASVGCIHTQPNLKPPPEPEVLASPGENDKRYCQPCVYPPETLANDPYKAQLRSDGSLPPQNQKKTQPPGFGGPPPGF